MTKTQEEYLYALNYFGFELKEITKRDLDIVYSAYEEKLNPEKTTIEEYKNGYEYKTMLRYYNLLSDIRKTNEVIDEILNPKPEVEVINNPEILDNYEPKGEASASFNNNQSYNNADNYSNEAKLDPRYTPDGILDRPSPLSIILAILIPLYGILISIFTWRLAPKASKWYLLCGIIGFILNFIIYFLYYYYNYR